MSITCKFDLSRSSNIYYNGEEIAGSLTICSVKQTQTEAITLEFYGQTIVQWRDLDKTENNLIHHNDFSTNELTDKLLYKHQQKHVSEHLQLDSSNSKILLQPHVEYTFQFCFTVPQQAPATYSCRYGQTEYGLRLLVQRTKKVNREFHQRIVIKTKLDLNQEIIYKKLCSVYQQNEFGQMNLEIPCTGFTPGQKIPYCIKYRTAQTDCKMLIQFNCYTTCRTQSNCKKFKQIKEIINFKKHLSPESSSCINIPLHCHISSMNNPELIITITYFLEAFLINGNKKVLLSASIPLTIGTSPCCITDGGFTDYMCYSNLGSSLADLDMGQSEMKYVDTTHSFADALFESFLVLPKKRKTHVIKSFRQCYKKLIKLL